MRGDEDSLGRRSDGICAAQFRVADLTVQLIFLLAMGGRDFELDIAGGKY